MTMLIRLNAGKGKTVYAKVSHTDYGKICDYQWSLNTSHHRRGHGRDYYAVRFEHDEQGKSITIRLHQEILGFPECPIKFMNDDGLDCRRENLEPANWSQIRQKSRKRASPCSSKYKGVSFRKDNKTWRAYITYYKRIIHLGTFHSEEQAAFAYDEQAIRLFGKFARTNFEE